MQRQNKANYSLHFSIGIYRNALNFAIKAAARRSHNRFCTRLSQADNSFSGGLESNIKREITLQWGELRLKKECALQLATLPRRWPLPLFLFPTTNANVSEVECVAAETSKRKPGTIENEWSKKEIPFVLRWVWNRFNHMRRKWRSHYAMIKV